MLEIKRIVKTNLSGTVDLPASKSIVNRYLIIAALSGNLHEHTETQVSNDTSLLRKALNSNNDSVDFEDAGTPLRFFIAYAALMNSGVWIDGNERLRVRPLLPLISALEDLGAEFEYKGTHGSLPLRIKKGLDKSRSHVKIAAGLSSQFLSALLLIAPCFDKGLIIETVGSTASVPYADLTAGLMRKAGAEVKHRENIYTIKSGRYLLKEPLEIESDWSAACFIYSLAVMAETVEINLPGLRLDSAQGDAETARVFEKFGIMSEQVSNAVRIKKINRKTEFLEMDFKRVPDMFPAIAALCAATHTRARFTGVKNLALKESDRIGAMRENLVQTGAVLRQINEDEVELEFPGTKNQAETYIFKSFDDHRIAMACSIFAFQRDIAIDDETVVRKSFPGYWDVFRMLTN